MRRTSLIGAALLVAALASAPSGAAGERAEAGRLLPASARVVRCSHGDVASERSAIFRGSTRRVAGARRMGMRFTLQERVGSGRFRTVRARGLGVWRVSRRGVLRFAHRQRVTELAEGSAYRVGVSFRWYDSRGRIVRRTKRRSSACRQPGTLANLRIGRISSRRMPGMAPGMVRHEVPVINDGAVAAEGASAELLVDGAELDVRSLGRIEPGQVGVAGFTGPACTDRLEARADPADSVRELTETDNARVVPCPPLR